MNQDNERSARLHAYGRGYGKSARTLVLPVEGAVAAAPAEGVRFGVAFTEGRGTYSMKDKDHCQRILSRYS